MYGKAEIKPVNHTRGVYNKLNHYHRRDGVKDCDDDSIKHFLQRTLMKNMKERCEQWSRTG